MLVHGQTASAIPGAVVNIPGFLRRRLPESTFEWRGGGLA